MSTYRREEGTQYDAGVEAYYRRLRRLRNTHHSIKIKSGTRDYYSKTKDFLVCTYKFIAVVVVLFCRLKEVYFVVL